MASIGVYIAIINDEKILLTLQEDLGAWGLPGGDVEPGESVAQAAVRLAREKTGLQVELTRLSGVYSHLDPASGDIHQVLFIARPIGGHLVPQAGVVVDIRYYAFAGLPADPIPWQVVAIQDALAGRGGALAWLLNRVWPFEPGINRSDLQEIQIRSELSPDLFYRYFMGQPAPGGDLLEVGAEGGRLGHGWTAFQDGALLQSSRHQPEVSANLAIIKNGKILLTKRKDFEVWCLPGGRVEAGESLAQAARREALEETGLEVRLTRLVGVYSEPRWFYRGLHVVVFAAEETGGSLALQPSEVIDYGYFSADELPSSALYGHTQRALDALAGAGGGEAWLQRLRWPFPATMTHEEIAAERENSGLDRLAFFRKHFHSGVLLEEIHEMGG